MAAAVTYSDPLAELLGGDNATLQPNSSNPRLGKTEVNESTPAAPEVAGTENPAPGAAQSVPAVVNESDMARLVGLTANRVRTLARDGVMIRAGRGQYDVRASLLTYIEDLRSKAARMGPGLKSTPSNSDLNSEKLRLAKQQADKIELQNAAARTELVKTSDVERAWAAVLRDVRATLLAVPSRCGTTLPHLTAHDVAELDREIRSALEGLADGN